jgi:hypothetical protein
MYKEIVERKKIASIFIILSFLVLSIVISDIIENLKVGNYVIGGYLTILLTLVVVLFTISQIGKCKVRYKYSVIVDELTIYKIKGSREEVLESIKVRDIENVKKAGLNINAIVAKKYGCVPFGNGLYVCKYNNGHGTSKFYFEPSCKLVDKLDVLKSRKAC